MSVVKFKAKSSSRRMECSSCGAEGTAGCDCGAPYVQPIDRAAEIAENDPGITIRALAKAAGVSHATAQRAKVVSGDTPNKRKVKSTTPPDDEMPSEEEADESWQQGLYDQACLLLERMAGATRQRLFAHIRRKYRNDDKGQD